MTDDLDNLRPEVRDALIHIRPDTQRFEINSWNCVRAELLRLTDLLDGWHVIDDELPPEETPIWLWDGKHCFIGEWVHDGYAWLYAKCFDVPWWDNEHGWRADNSEADDYNPTHWRSLPQPPNARNQPPAGREAG